MDLTSIYFFAFCLLFVCFYRISPSEKYRTGILAAANILFIATYADSWLSLVPLFSFVMLGYGAICCVKRYRNGAPAGVVIAAFILLFVWLKHYSFVSFVPSLPFAFVVVGLSYMLFRILHLMFEVSGGTLEVPTFGRYFAYVCFFLCFISGPIQRYDEFDIERRRPRTLNDDVAIAAFSRIVLGYFKVVVVSEFLHAAYQREMATLLGLIGPAQGTSVVSAIAHFDVTAAIYAIYLYADFSGYMDLVIGVGRLVGITLPENFNRPWVAGNFLNFWARWHMTLSNWFRIYLFNPLLKALVRRWNSAAVAPYLEVIAFFVTFLVLGAWHGASAEFLVCGFLFGAGVSLNKLYQVELARRLGKRRYQALTRKRFYATLCRGGTMAYFAFALATFWLSMHEMERLVLRIGAGGLALSLATLTAASAVAIVVLNSLAHPRFLSWMAAIAPRRLVTRCAFLGFLVFVLALLVPWIGARPEFVYKAF